MAVSAVLQATDATWPLVEDMGGVVVIDFWKDDCKPCARLAPQIENLAQRFPNVTFIKANVSDAPAAAAKFGVTTFPMVYILKDGLRRTFFGGWMPEEVIADMIQENL